MAYYENRTEHLGGDLILYQRNLKTAAPNSKNHRQAKWYMKLRIGPRQTINRSTGLTNYEEAYSFARKEFDRLRKTTPHDGDNTDARLSLFEPKTAIIAAALPKPPF